MAVTIGLRPVLPADIPVLMALFVASIEELTEDDYSPAQQEAWMSALDDEALAARLKDQLALVATVSGAIAGFAALKGGETIDLLYVDPRFARQGVASALVGALETLASARGGKVLKVDASDTALPLFQARGYQPQQRNSVSLAGEWLSNTSMKKTLSPLQKSSVQ